jgi:UDPglucose 6-dehydrogenase
MKIIIAGFGFVGKAVKETFRDTNEVIVVDPKYTTQTILEHNDADGIIICVNTPPDEKGGCDIANVLAVMDQVPIYMPVMIKSTVSPDKIQNIIKKYEQHSIVYSPEFLRAVSAVDDFKNQKHIIIGGDDPLEFWHLLFKDNLPNLKIVHKCSIEEASIIKYAINSFLAVKVSFFNHLFDICNANGQSFDVVRQLVCQDVRIGTSHTMVPGLDGDRGWGGACFPKDTLAFVHYARSLNSNFDLLETAIEYNNKIKDNEQKIR